MKNLTRKCVLLSAFLFIGCGGVRLANARKVANPIEQRVQRVLVIASATLNDSANRARIETHCARNLQFLGQQGVSSYRFLSARDFKPENEAETMRQIAHDSIDAIMTVSLLNWDIEKEAMPEDLWCSPYNNYNRSFWCYQSQIANRTGMAGYYNSSSRYIWEFNLYNASDQRLLYCARTCAKGRKKSIESIFDYCDLVFADMVWQRVFKLE